MARGRKPTPTSVLRMRGSKWANRGDEPQAPMADGLSDPPDWFDETACAKWTELVPILTAMRVLTVADLDYVRSYCAAYARWVKAERKLKEGGEVVVHSNGVEGISHWLKVSQAALERMDKSGAELGLSPVARSRIKAEPPANISPEKAKFFAQADKSRFFPA